MPSPTKLVSAVFLVASVLPAATFTYHIAGDDPGPWPQILSSIGLVRAAGGPANLFVVRTVAPGSIPQWIERVEQGGIVVLEGDNELAAALGFKPTDKRVVIRSIVDWRAPKLPIVWENSVETPVFELPKSARVFANERWGNAPVMAAVRKGAGAALWIAAAPGKEGYERFPYLLQALKDLGVEPPFRSERLWAFFDGAYRSHVDLDYFAKRWRAAGIGALHVAGWHYYESNPELDEYLRRLIEACHKQAILVYVWLELPHVSEQFWADHPEWREKTAILQDAQLDWRKLMNLTNRDCFAAVSKGVTGLVQRFDWDGVNLAELYFESLEGAANPARFTPMNVDVREEFRKARGFDPLDLFAAGKTDQSRLAQFLEFRASLARRQQEEWIGQIEAIRSSKPDLDFVLTHVDDRFDTRMRDLIGADAARVLPLLDQHDFTFLIEDPATIWNLGPQRYPKIAAQYQPLTKQTSKLAIDINVVERYQDVYPTKQQTGTELFQLVHLASQAFPRVALYFENSILPPDLPLLASAAANVSKIEQEGPRLVVDSPRGVGIPWQGSALVNGRLWPVRGKDTLWLPSGAVVVESTPVVVESTPKEPALQVLDFNGELRSASASASTVSFSYQSSARAMAVLSARPAKLEIDGAPVQRDLPPSGSGFLLTLPRGQHLVRLEVAAAGKEKEKAP
ncbi:MAG TPA: hypothetical protein VKG79_00465 [Bryobacteraceae bacterium]|nr:hypothetical protein [Bryobacteraceae bacterium]